MAAEQAELLGCPPPGSCPRVAKLSVFGVGMKSHATVASRLFQALAAEGINVELISTTEVRVNVVVDGRHGEKGRAGPAARIRRRDGVAEGGGRKAEG